MGHAARGAIAVLLTLVVLKESPAVPETITSYELILLYVAFGFGALATYAWREGVPSPLSEHLDLREDGPVLVKLVGAGVATVGLLWVMTSLDGPGLPEANRSLAFAGVYLLVLTYPVFHQHVGRLVRRNWPYLLAFAALFGVYLRHGATYAAGSAVAAFPIAVGFLLVVNLFVLPRYVSVDDFLWVVARISAVVVGIGVLAYVFGEYTAMSVPVTLGDRTFSPLLLPVEIRPLKAIFGNPNTAGILAFAGTLAALAELQRNYDRGRSSARRRELISPDSVPALLVSGALLLVNGVGLYLTHSRASLLAAGVGGSLIVVAAWSGRDTLPYAAFATAALVFAALATVAAGVLDVNPGGRIVLWSGGVEAILRAPTLLGEGIVETGPIIEPYVTDPVHQGSGVHNSYLTTAIRAGLLGGAAHLVLAVGSLVHALTVERAVGVAPVALGAGFAVHQLFESYTLFHHSMGALLASLAVGYLIAAIRDARPVETESTSEPSNMADVFDERSGRSSGS